MIYRCMKCMHNFELVNVEHTEYVKWICPRCYSDLIIERVVEV